jgi:hypothetical protein
VTRIVRRNRAPDSEPRLHQDQRKPGVHSADTMARDSWRPDRGNPNTPSMNSGRPSRDSAEAGSTTVEAGVTISVLLLVILAIVELGQTFLTYNTVLLAVEEAGRYAMVHNQSPPNTCGSQSQAPRCPTLSNTQLANCSAERAQQVLSVYQAPRIDVSATEDTTSSPATITICATVSLDFVVPQLLRYGPINLTRQVTVPLI